MRKNYFEDWSFAIQGSIQNIVKEKYKHEIHRWPTTKIFKSEGFIWASSHLIIILREKISGIPTMGKVIEDDGTVLPTEKPVPQNIHIWQDAARKKYGVNPEDVVVIIPIIGNGPSVKNDWEQWDEVEKQLWHWQIEHNIEVHFYFLKGFEKLGDFFLPPGYLFLADQCKSLFEDHPRYDRNIFIMTRLVKGNHLLEELDKELRQVLRDHDLDPLRADDKMYMPDRNLWNNICVYMLS